MSAPNPPAPVYPPYPPPPNIIFVSAHRRARLVAGLMMAFICVNLMTIGYELFEINYYARMMEGVVSEEEEFFYALVAIGSGLLYLIVYISTAVLFLMWVHRAYKNLQPLGAPRVESTPGWAVGYFFIPIVNLFYPYRIMRELWRKSDPEVQDPDHYLALPQSTPAILPLWWAAWLVSSFLDQLVFRLSMNNDAPSDLIWITKLGILAGVINIVSAILATLVVVGIDKRQEARAQHFMMPQTPPPPPQFDQPAGSSILKPPA